MSKATQARQLWRSGMIQGGVLVLTALTASGAAATEQDVRDALQMQRQLIDRSYEMGKKLGKASPARVELLEKVTYNLTGRAVRNPMLKHMDEHNQETADQLTRELKSRPAYKELQTLASETLKKSSTPLPSGLVTETSPPPGMKGQAGIAKNLVLPKIDGAMSRSQAPEKPGSPAPSSREEVAIDGGGIASEIEFKGKAPEAQPKSLREQVLESVRRKLGL